MTAATSGRSFGASVSFSTIDAMISTSYGVRFFFRAYARSTDRQFVQNARSCSTASCLPFVVARKSYVAGKRKPSRFFAFLGVKHGSVAVRVAAAYFFPFSTTGLCRLRFAIFATTSTRWIICALVKPSGKITRNGFGGGGGGGGSARLRCTWGTATAT